MGYTCTIVCLANSRKPPSGRCIAGRVVTPSRYGEWIRPVSERPTREISEEDRRYSDGTDPMLLDIIAITMIRPAPEHHQQENHLIDPDYYWQRMGALSPSDVEAAVEDPGGPLWLNGHSSSNGLNDQVPAAEAHAFVRSLYLIRPEELTLVVASEGGDFAPPRRRVRAKFQLHGEAYCLVVTDPQLERSCLARSDGQKAIQNALICVSLAEVFHGFAYKLAASVIVRE